MTAMVTRTSIGLAVLLLIAAMASFACGGGAAKSGTNGGQPITDPARVPSSTPIGQSVATFLYRADGHVDATGGATTTVAPGATSQASGSKTYTVASGDTCGAIVKQFGITLDELRRSNRLIDDSCGNLHTGDVLKIPAPAAAAGTTPGAGGTAAATSSASGKTYTVASGDTCEGIAKANGVTSAALIAANGIDANCQGLKPGQTLKIP
jgi:LysM repeat protein